MTAKATKKDGKKKPAKAAKGRKKAATGSRAIKEAAKASVTGELVVEGAAVGPGIAIGLAYLHEAGALTVPEYIVPASQVQKEVARFTEAAAQASGEVARLQGRIASVGGSGGEELGILLDAYQQMLKGSRLIRNVQTRIANDRVNAEAAVQTEIGLLAEAFASMDDAYLSARVDDVRDVGNRLIRALTKTQHRPFSTLPKNSVIIADSLTPADAAQIDPKQVAGFATALGARESHTAIMARSLGLAAVVGAHGLLGKVAPRKVVIVDGLSGRVIVDPSDTTLEDYRQRRADHLREQRALARLKKAPATTKDGVEITLQANLELPMEAQNALDAGAQGVGLLRSEFMFMNRPDLPGEDEQAESLSAMVKAMQGRPVTIRTLDVGSDKMGDAIGVEMGPNPALGLRAIRLSLKRPELLETQLAAILRAGAHGPIRVLLPMVTCVGEIRTVRDAMTKVHRRLRRQKTPVVEALPPLGVMIEVPAAALAADALAWESEFFALGTNDLTQYTLAIDRSDEQVAGLYDSLHPAVIKLIQLATDSALKARIPVSLCGEMAGDERVAPLLMGLGIRDLSMTWNNIPKVKRRIRSMDYTAAVARTRLILEQTDPKRISRLLDEFIG